MIGRGVWGHLPEEKVWGGQVHERHERECRGSEGHRALVEVKSYKLLPSRLNIPNLAVLLLENYKCG